jgi:hypothetical protein
MNFFFKATAIIGANPVPFLNFFFLLTSGVPPGLLQMIKIIEYMCESTPVSW